jgi:hypothetical protein
MSERKYDYLFKPEPLLKSGYPPHKDMLLNSMKEQGLDFQIRFTHVSIPFKGAEKPHTHEFDEVFLFVPCSDDLRAYDAVSELYIEGEKYIIDKCTAVYMPAGIEHCPLNHIRVGTPFFFVNCVLSKDYIVVKDGQKFEPGLPDSVHVEPLTD